MFCVVKGLEHRQVRGWMVEQCWLWTCSTCPPSLGMILNKQMVIAWQVLAEDAAPGHRQARCLLPGRAPRELPWTYCNPQVLLPVSHRTPSLSRCLPFVHMIAHWIVHANSRFSDREYSYFPCGRNLEISLSSQEIKFYSYKCYKNIWPIPLAARRGFAAARFPGLRVRIPPGAWISVSCEFCVLSRRVLCDGSIPRPEESYRVWCVIEWDLVQQQPTTPTMSR